MGMPTKTLLSETGKLSINQMGLVSTLCCFNKIMQSKKPVPIFKKCSIKETRSGTKVQSQRTKTRRGTTDESFIERACKAFNSLPRDLRVFETTKSHKQKLKLWAKEKIPVKP